MPSTRDWIRDPLAVVEGMFAASQSSQSSGWETKAVEFFKEQLKDREAQTLVPSLNDVPLHYLKPDSLVRFRCLVQDMFDPEFFMGVYETVDPNTQARTLRCGKYRDMTESGVKTSSLQAPGPRTPRCSRFSLQVDLNSRNTVTAERQTFYCVPIPGENQWAKDGFAASARHQVVQQVVPSTSYVPSRQKRSYEEDEEMEVQPQKQKETHAASPSGADPHGTGAGRRQETAAPSGAAASASHLDLNFPLPGEKGPSCLLKVYEDWDRFRLNDALQVFGILSVSPALNALADEKDPVLDPDPEQRVQNPPASLVPRLHLLHAERLDHSNPLLPAAALQDNGAFLSSALGEMAAVRAELLSYFTHILLGDALAAEFLLLHLLSSVYSRRDVLPLGKFSLNLSGCPAAGYTQRLYQAVQQLIPASFYLPMSLQNLNRMRLVPRKDYVSNRLLSGALQLAARTSLFLDETRLEPGQLDAVGVRNVAALGNLITWQKVDYDFSFHQMEFPCNINVLIASEGRSLLPSDCHVHLQPQVAPAHLEHHLSSIQVQPQLNRFRVFLSAGRLLDYSISDDVTKAVEDDFVDMRKDDPHSVSADDLHRMLVVARLLSLSLGQTSLTRDIWVRAKHIDTLRRSRMEQHKSVNGNEP